MVESILHVLLIRLTLSELIGLELNPHHFYCLFAHLNYNDIFLTKKVECDFQVINKTDVFFEVRISQN